MFRYCKDLWEEHVGDPPIGGALESKPLRPTATTDDHAAPAVHQNSHRQAMPRWRRPEWAGPRTGAGNG